MLIFGQTVTKSAGPRGRFGEGICGPLRRADRGGGGTQRLGRPNRDGAALLYAQRLIADSNGNLYGTTVLGGASASCGGGCRTVFKLSPSGTETVLHSFTIIVRLRVIRPKQRMIHGPGTR
jgi:uncharacterized repeat protein (TIGR03803 family)